MDPSSLKSEVTHINDPAISHSFHRHDHHHVRKAAAAAEEEAEEAEEEEEEEAEDPSDQLPLGTERLLMKKKKSPSSTLHSHAFSMVDFPSPVSRLGLDTDHKHDGAHFHHHDAPAVGPIARHSERFNSMGVLDIMRESSVLLRANSSILMYIMVLLICPVSLLLLSHAFVQGKLAHRLSLRLHRVVTAAGLNYSSVMESTYSSLSQAFLTYTFSSPALFTLWLLAKASIIFAVCCTYAGKRPSFLSAITAALKLWKRLFCTYIWISILLLGFGSLAVLLFLLLIGLLDSLQFSADLIFLTELALGLFYSVIFAQMIVTGNLANVVCIIEELHGLSAIAKSLHMIKGKIQVALSLFLATAICTAMVESLYQYRVIGVPKSAYAINTASRMWEGPLLVFMYSFLWLMDAIMSCVFYFSCQSAAPGVSDKHAVWENISIGVELTDP